MSLPKGMLENPIKRWPLQTLSTISISLVYLCTETIILHFALTFVERSYLFFPFFSPCSLHMHSPSTHAQTLTSTFSLKNTDHRYKWWFMGEEDRNYFFLKILVYFSWLTPILVWRQPQSCVHWMILFHFSLSSSLSLLNQQKKKKKSGLSSLKTTPYSCHHQGHSKGDCESWFWPSASLNRGIHCIAYMHK